MSSLSTTAAVSSSVSCCCCCCCCIGCCRARTAAEDGGVGMRLMLVIVDFLFILSALLCSALALWYSVLGWEKRCWCCAGWWLVFFKVVFCCLVWLQLSCYR